MKYKYKFLLISWLIVAVALISVGMAKAEPIDYLANLTGAKESPPNSSPGTGSVTAIFDFTTHMLDLEVAFSGLTSPTIAAHIHAPTAIANLGTAGVATQVPFFDGFPIGVTSGTYNHTFNTLDLSFYNPDFVTANGGTAAGAEAALAQALSQHKAYFNIHTENFPKGEIRGFLFNSVPDAGSNFVCLGMALIGLALLRRRIAPRSSASNRQLPTNL